MPTAHRQIRANTHLAKRAGGVLLAGAMALSAAACSSSSAKHNSLVPRASTNTIGPAPSMSPRSDRVETAKASVMDVYNRYWAEQVKAYAKASDKGTDLRKYATTQALSRALADLQSLKAAHMLARGEPRHKASVTAIGLDKKLPDARITDCLDVTEWKRVTDSGKSLPHAEDVLNRYVAVSTAEKWGKRWMITKVDLRGRAC